MQIKFLFSFFFLFVNVGLITSQVITYSQTIKNSACDGSNNGSAEIIITSTNSPYTFLWSNGATTNAVYNLPPKDYSVIITDNLSNTITVNITIAELDCHFFADIYFSPNEDGFYDTWSISGLEDFPDNLVAVYNRFGQKVFESKGPYEPWDGKDLLGTPLPDGTYFYMIFANKKSKTPATKGSVSILR